MAPPCPYFGRCGGCHYQHASYEAQLDAKRAILVEELWRQAKIRVEAEIADGGGRAVGLSQSRAIAHRGGAAGISRGALAQAVRHRSMPHRSPKINAAIAALNAMMRDRRWPRFVRSVELFTDEERVQLNVVETERPVARRFFDWCAETIPGLVPGALDYRGRVSRER